MKSVPSALLVIALALPAQAEEAEPEPDSERKLTVGVVQRVLEVGMPIEDVAIALGSPNIVTRDAEGLESWIYDRIATEVRHERSSKGLGGGGFGTGSGSSFLLAALLGGRLEREKRVSTLSQRSLTVVVKLDSDGRVASFSYRASRF